MAEDGGILEHSDCYSCEGRRAGRVPNVARVLKEGIRMILGDIDEIRRTIG